MRTIIGLTVAFFLFTCSSIPRKIISYNEVNVGKGVVDQTCIIKIKNTGSSTEGVIIKNKNSQENGLGQLLDLTLDQEFLAASKIEAGETVTFSQNISGVENGDLIVLQLSCDAENCYITDDKHHIIQSYLKGGIPFEKTFDCLDKEMKPVNYQISGVFGAVCSKDELEDHLIDNFDWFDSRFRRIIFETRTFSESRSIEEITTQWPAKQQGFADFLSSDQELIKFNDVILKLLGD